MKLSRLVATLFLAACLAGVAYVGQQIESAGNSMASAAEELVGSLTDEQKAKAVFPFDSKERTNWHFIPMQDAAKKPTRKGLPLQEMTGEQRKAALKLVKAGTSAAGNKAALTIMSLEAILRDLEKKGAMVRNPDWYFFTVFGKPSKSDKWGWRVEGHHLSLNFVVDNGKIGASTPAFFGANPATVMGGTRKGLRTLPEAEDLAKELFKSLGDEQQKVAFQAKQFPEIKQGTADSGVGAPRGLKAENMSEKQRSILVKLVQSYASRLPDQVSKEQIRQVKEAGIDKIHFAYAGGLEPGKPYTYRLQGPTFVVEFLNVQPDSAGNPANHIHSVWRNLKGDFGVAAD
jgi:hypothetical protein